MLVCWLSNSHYLDNTTETPIADNVLYVCVRADQSSYQHTSVQLPL